MPSTKVEWARHFAAKGFPVFPVVENTKRARIERWPSLATTDPAQIDSWWEQWPNDNIGFCTTDFVVIDIDPRKGGIESFAALSDVMPFDKSARHITQGDGAHVIYAIPHGQQPVKGGNDKLGPGLDVKARGGYILLPGSTIDGRSYRVANERQVAGAMPWLLDACKVSQRKTGAAGQRIVEEDDTARELFERWVLDKAPTAETGNIDNTTYKVAARGYDFACSPETVLDIMLEWNETKCFPPQDMEDLERVVESAGRNRENAIGSAHPLAPGFEAIEIDESKAPAPEPAPLPKGKLYVLRADEAARIALERRGEPLIQGIIDRGTMSVLVGKGGGGKTFLALDWSYHVARGRDWAGKRVKRGAVVYLAAEAGNMILSRLKALEAHYGALGDAPLYVIPCPANFSRGPEDVRAILALIRDVEAASGQKVELFVVDTLARVMTGDENSAKDMGVIIESVDYVRQQVGCHAMLIHHPNKAGTSARGSGNVFGGTDTEMWVDEHKTLSFTKQRDMPKGNDIRFKLVPVRLGTDADGAPVTSCVVHVSNPGEAEPRVELSGRLRDVWEALEAALDEAKRETFDMAFLKKIWTENGVDSSVDTCPSRPTIIRWMSELSESGYLKKGKPGEWVRVGVQSVQ